MPNEIIVEISKSEIVVEIQKNDIIIEMPATQGIQGIEGKSSYEIYVENGWTLSEQDWIDSFVDTYSKTELEDLLDENFQNYYTKTDIDNMTVDGGNF